MATPADIPYRDLTAVFDAQIQKTRGQFKEIHKHSPKLKISPEYIISCLRMLAQSATALKEKKFSHLTPEDIQTFNEMFAQRIHQIDTYAKENLSEERSSQEDIEKIAQNLNSFREVFVQVLSHEKDLQLKGFKSFLGEEWAQKELALLVSNNHEGAIAIMHELIAANNPLGHRLFLHSYTEMKGNERYFNELWFVQGVMNIWRADDEMLQYRVSQIMGYALKKVNCPWIKAILEHSSQKPRISDYEIKLIVDAYVKYRHIQLWVEPMILEWFEHANMYAMHVICVFLHDYDRRLSNLEVDAESAEEAILDLSRNLIERAQDKLILQQSLICIAALAPESSPFKSALGEAITWENITHEFYPNDEWKQTLERIQELSDEILSNSHNEVHWKLLPYFFRYEFLLSFLKREERLHQLLSRPEEETKKYQHAAVIDSFPQATHVLFGLTDRQEGGRMSPALDSLASQLGQYHVKVLSFGENLGEQPLTSENMSFIEGDLKTCAWVRDGCDALASGMRLPFIPLEDSEYIGSLVESARESRFEDSFGNSEISTLIASLGGSLERLSQVGYYNYFSTSQECPLDPFHGIAFTFSEGGNTLVGQTQEGVHYAIVGKDTLEVNRILLTRELANLGWRKDNLEWVRTEAFSEAELFLTDDDVRFFLGLDLGIDRSQIYFVENLDYHLDLRMAILEGKKIIVNDSMMAYEIWKEFASNKIAEGFQFKESLPEAEYYKRLDQLQMKSIMHKQVEDLVASELVRQGFKVTRVGGVFENLLKPHPENFRTNLFNFLSMTTKEDKRIITALGCEKYFQEYFKKILSTAEVAVDDILFYDETKSRNLLSLDGGLRCSMRVLRNT